MMMMMMMIDKLLCSLLLHCHRRILKIRLKNSPQNQISITTSLGCKYTRNGNQLFSNVTLSSIEDS